MTLPAPDFDADGADRMYPCDCGEEHAAVWWTGRPSAGKPGQWVSPKISPCELCHVDEALVRKQDLDRRMLASGFDETLLPWDFETMIHQQGEELEPFMARIAGLEWPQLGVLEENRVALSGIRRWDPRRKDHPRFLVITGIPGTGKSSVLGALGRRFMARGQRELVPLTARQVGGEERLEALRLLGRDMRVRMPRSMHCRYVHIKTLVDAERSRSSYGGDPDKAKHLGTYRGILMVDELGLSEGDRMEDAGVEELINRRSAKALPLVVSTNRTKRELLGDGCDPLFSSRVADRLKRAAFLHVGGPSWR